MKVDGSWALVIDSPMGKQKVIITLKEEAGQLTGTLLSKSNKMTTDLFDGGVVGGELTWKAELQLMDVTLTFNTAVEDDVMSGKVNADLFGNFNLSGHRV
ncbi:hypothetical protein [Actinoplanes sp. NPDC051411]|uniref:hypothetical protein n=1 Tax=Actinoplanes sp. NPDC051411 TaxID=3155522 RepID=UPI003448ED70